MSVVNSYKPPAPAPYSPSSKDPYDINFVIPIENAELRTARIKLTPFVPSVHAIPFYERASKSPELWRYIPPAFPTLREFCEWHEQVFQRDPSAVLFAIIVINESNPDDESNIGGIVGFEEFSVKNRSTEIAPVLVLPAFQRTFVTSNAVGILLRYCLDLPSASPSGLGFRRVQWTANPDNVASIRTAERMGLQHEGRLKWTMVLDKTKAGQDVEGDERGDGPGRGSVMFAICWDDWEHGGREHVRRLIDRIF